MSEAAADSLRAYVSSPARVLSESGSLASAPASRARSEVAGAEHVHLAEPAETAARRGPKRRAKTIAPTRDTCASC